MREIDSVRTRLVLTGNATAPSSATMEYVIKNGDMLESPLRADVAIGVSISATLTDGIDVVETAEGI